MQDEKDNAAEIIEPKIPAEIMRIHDRGRAIQKDPKFRDRDSSDTAVKQVTINRTHFWINGKSLPIKNDFNGKKARITRFEESTALHQVTFNPPQLQGYGPMGAFHLSDFKFDGDVEDRRRPEPPSQADIDNLERWKGRMREHAAQCEVEYKGKIREYLEANKAFKDGSWHSESSEGIWVWKDDERIKQEMIPDDVTQGVEREWAEYETGGGGHDKTRWSNEVSGGDVKWVTGGGPPNIEPYPRHMVQVSKPDNPDDVIRHLQFNILADGLSSLTGGFAVTWKLCKQMGECTRKDHPTAGEPGMHDKGGMMHWDVRCIRLVATMIQHAPDVITCQELDHYWDWMKPTFAKLDYDTAFWPKPKSSAAKFSEHKMNDGMCIAWNKHRLVQLGVTRKFVYRDAEGNPLKSGGLYVLLRNKVTGKKFVVITSHNKSGKKAKDIPAKKIQAAFLANLIRTELRGYAVLVGHDLNTSHDTSTFEVWEKLTPTLRSTYKDAGGDGTEGVGEKGEHPPFTTSKWRKGGDQLDKLGYTAQTIDFIWYNEGYASTRAVLSIPQKSELEILQMPGWRYPSDHFSIMADVEILEERRTGPAEI